MEWRRLTQPEEPAFGRAMALYEASFPRHEQRLPDEQRAVLSHPEYHFIQLFDGAEFVGLLLYWEAEDFRYVEHFCVRPELRGRRYGAKALEELGRDGKTVVLEIDPPVDDIARRRQGFYQRCGFAVNPYPHVHPPYRPEYPGHELVVLSSPRALTPAEYGAFACYLSAVVKASHTPVRPSRAASSRAAATMATKPRSRESRRERLGCSAAPRKEAVTRFSPAKGKPRK